SISPNSPRPTRRQAPSDAFARRRLLKARRGLQCGGAGQDEFHNFALAAGIGLAENLAQLRADRVHADAPFLGEIVELVPVGEAKRQSPFRRRESVKTADRVNGKR